MNFASGLWAAVFAIVYYAVAYGILILFKVRKERLFRYATIPLAVFGVVWVAWAISQNGWGGAIVAVMLLSAAGLAWLVKRMI